MIVLNFLTGNSTGINFKTPLFTDEFTTYSDKNGELVIKHYCALGTQPMFTVDELSDDSIVFKSDPSSGYHSEHHNFVKSISWSFDSDKKETLIMRNSVFIDGELQNNKAVINKVY